jgi:hypothetical protein
MSERAAPSTAKKLSTASIRKSTVRREQKWLLTTNDWQLQNNEHLLGHMQQ